MFNRVRNWLRRRRNSLRFGLPFRRSRDARLPSHLRLSETTVELRAPTEAGVNADFVTVFLDNCYGLLDLTLPANARVIDVGANIGLFSLATRLRFPDAIIHAYEPNPRLSTFIQHHADAAKFTYFAEAITVHDGFVSLVDRADSNLVTAVASGSSGIPSTSFARAVDRIGGSVDLLKLDCEGGEWPLLADHEVWASVKNVTFEYHLWATTDVTHEDVVRRLRQLGFSIASHVREHTTGTIRARRI